MTKPDWVAYLESLAAFGMRPGLERVTAILDRLDRPQDALRVVHVVGTNGKSSTTRYCEALLRAHGRRSGAYVSPHILGWNERVLVAGEPIDSRRLGRCVMRVADQAARLPQEQGVATQFEVLTAAALLAFAESGVEDLVLEAGLGGRLDATNVVQARVVVLTNVELEHTHVLGDTREQIFDEKAAVIKGGEVVFGALDGLEGRARAICTATGARAHVLGADFTVRGDPGSFAVEDVALDVQLDGLALATPASYQVTNAGLAIVAARLLLGGLDDARTRRALGAVRVPGRFQVIGQHPLVIADGAHNLHGLRQLMRSLAALALPAPRVGVVAIMRDKGYRDMLAELAPHFDHLVCTQAAEARSMTAEELAMVVADVTRAVGVVVAVSACPDPRMALESARELAGADGFVLVTGSLFLLEDLRDTIVASLYLRETQEG